MLARSLSVHIVHEYYVIVRPADTAGTAVNLPILGQAIVDADWLWVQDIVATEVEVAIKANIPLTTHHVAALYALDLPITTGRTWQLPVYFSDGDDWRHVVAHSQLSVSDYVTRLASTTFTYAMHGFLPGFMYLAGLPPQLHVPRKSSPTKRPVQHAFAVGGSYTGVYDLPSPSGWHVLGQVPIAIYERGQVPTVSPGDHIHICPIGKDKYQQLLEESLTLSKYHHD